MTTAAAWRRSRPRCVPGRSPLSLKLAEAQPNFGLARARMRDQHSRDKHGTSTASMGEQERERGVTAAWRRWRQRCVPGRSLLYTPTLHTPHTLHSAPYTPHSTHPTLYTQHPTSYTLHPTPCAWQVSSGRVFIMNTIYHGKLEPFIQKLGYWLQFSGEESYS